MLKFIVLLIVIFALFFVGGSILFDSGITKESGVDRIPVAVQTEKFYRSVQKQVQIYVLPNIKMLTDRASGLMNPE